jgi:hypothetical protein
MPLQVDFEPNEHGWFFDNWGEATEFTWDLYRDAYLGINPTQDPVQAPLDCAFFEIFKNCAQKGNCGGMSLLGLALFKYGGYMGFCSPACFYTGGGSGPDRADLHRAINIFQARQFSVSGIENFIDVVDAGNLNNATAAYNRVQECLGRGDYAVLSIAKGLLGDAAHTVIPYKCYASGGTKYLEIWDPNHPADDNPAHYGSANARMVINGPTAWTYYPNPGTAGSTPYQGSDNGWCFAIPMSTVLQKDRQPFALDFAFDALQTAFVTGPGAAVSQISDDSGHRLYAAGSAPHVNRGELETDPARRLKGVARWPWYARAGAREGPFDELYFVRGAASRSDLQFAVSGSTYRFVHFHGRHLLELAVSSDRGGRDVIRVSPPADGLPRTVEMAPAAGKRMMNLRAVRAGDERGAWRSVEIRNARLVRNAVRVDLLGELDHVQVKGVAKNARFSVHLAERRNRRMTIDRTVRAVADAVRPFEADLRKKGRR